MDAATSMRGNAKSQAKGMDIKKEGEELRPIIQTSPGRFLTRLEEKKERESSRVLWIDL